MLGQTRRRKREEKKREKTEPLRRIETRTVGRRQRQRLNVTVSPDVDAGRRFLGEYTRETLNSRIVNARHSHRDPIRDDVASSSSRTTFSDTADNARHEQNGRKNELEFPLDRGFFPRSFRWLILKTNWDWRKMSIAVVE